MTVPLAHILVVSGALFALGVLGFLLRRNMIVLLASIELMLNAANLAFLAASRDQALAGLPHLEGPIFAMFVILVAAAEASVGLALVIAVYRLHKSVSIDAIRELKG